MTTQNISSVRIGSIALIAFVLLALMVSPSITRAADYDGWIDTGYYNYSEPSYDSGNEWIDTGYYNYSEPSYDGYDNSSNSYGYGGYNYSTPSYGGYSYYTPSYSTPRSSSGGSSNIYAPTNTCTAPNSCNDNSIFNAPTVVTVTTVDNSTGSKKSKKNYDNDRPVYHKPIAYNTPYVSLSAAPYTGLELGPVGTAVYWGFLALWSLVAAYLIVVKRVQNKIFRSLNSFLFGDNEVAPAKVAYAGTPVARKQNTQDDFILNQISRVRTS